jgi:hypothetical protein
MLLEAMRKNDAESWMKQGEIKASSIEIRRADPCGPALLYLQNSVFSDDS